MDIEKLITRILNKIDGKSNQSDIQLTSLPSLSNDVYKVEVYNSTSATNKLYLLKIFRTFLDQLTNKPIQNDVVSSLAKQQQYPTVYFANEKLRLEEFIQGRLMARQSATKQQLLELMKILGNVTKTFKNYHKQQSQHFQQQRQISQMFSTFHEINKNLQKSSPESYKKCKQYTLKILDEKIKQHLLEIVPKEMIATHNDCHSSNIIVSQKGKLYLIDYQFFCPNYRGYELGNFFLEFATDYADNCRMSEKLQLDEETQNLLIQKYYEEIGVKIPFVQAKRQVQVGKILSRLFWLFIGVKQIQDPKMQLDMQFYIKSRYEQFMNIYNKF